LLINLILIGSVGFAIGTARAQTRIKAKFLESDNLLAKAAYIYDINNERVIWSKNGEAQLPLASLAKLMTVFAGTRENVTDERTACITLTTSSNELAEQIGGKLSLGIDTLNSHAKELGLWQTFYLNATGLDVNSTLAGAYGSARDVAHLVSTFYRQYPGNLECTANENIEVLGKITPNTNEDVGMTIGVLGSKTGFTDLAGGNLTIIFDSEINHPIIIVVMGSTIDGRFEDVRSLIRATFRFMEGGI